MATTSYSKYALTKMDRDHLAEIYADISGTEYLPKDAANKTQLIEFILAEQSASGGSGLLDEEFEGDVEDLLDPDNPEWETTGPSIIGSDKYEELEPEGTPMFGSDGEFLGEIDEDDPESDVDVVPEYEDDAVMVGDTVIGGFEPKEFPDEEPELTTAEVLAEPIEAAEEAVKGPRGGKIVNGITTSEYRLLRKAGTSPHDTCRDIAIKYFTDPATAEKNPSTGEIDGVIIDRLSFNTDQASEITKRWYINVSATAKRRLWAAVQRSLLVL